jgi:hypothetical protein
MIQVSASDRTEAVRVSFTRRSLQNPTPGVLVAEGVNFLGRQTELWSTKAKVWGIAPKTARHRGGE